MTTTALRRAGLLAVPLALALSLSACGGGGGGRPSADDVASALQSESKTMTPDAAKCLSQAMAGSKLSDAFLTAIVKNNKNYKPSKSDESVLKGMESKILQCAAKALPSGAPSALASMASLVPSTKP